MAKNIALILVYSYYVKWVTTFWEKKNCQKKYIKKSSDAHSARRGGGIVVEPLVEENFVASLSVYINLAVIKLRYTLFLYIKFSLKENVSGTSKLICKAKHTFEKIFTSNHSSLDVVQLYNCKHNG